MQLGGQLGAGSPGTNYRDVQLAGAYRPFLGLRTDARVNHAPIEALRLSRRFPAEPRIRQRPDWTADL